MFVGRFFCLYICLFNILVKDPEINLACLYYATMTILVKDREITSVGIMQLKSKIYFLD